jgi:hypothetical protein
MLYTFSSGIVPYAQINTIKPNSTFWSLPAPWHRDSRVVNHHASAVSALQRRCTAHAHMHHKGEHIDGSGSVTSCAIHAPRHPTCLNHDGMCPSPNPSALCLIRSWGRLGFHLSCISSTGATFIHSPINSLTGRGSSSRDHILINTIYTNHVF